MLPDDPVTAALVILSAAVTGLGGLLAGVVRALIKGDLVARQVLTDERAASGLLLDEARELAALERARADLAQTQLDSLTRETGRTTVALLASIETRAARAASDGRDDAVATSPAGAAE